MIYLRSAWQPIVQIVAETEFYELSPSEYIFKIILKIYFLQTSVVFGLASGPHNSGEGTRELISLRA